MSYQRKFQEDMQRATGRFQDLVQENKVMMFSSTNCSYCDIAKETFQSMGTQFKSLEVNKLGVDGAMMRNTLKSVTGERTVPAIFICGEPVKGGSNGLTELATSGRLSNMLERCCKGDATCGSWQHRRWLLSPKIVSSSSSSSSSSVVTTSFQDCLVIIIIKSFAQDYLKSSKFRCAVRNICMIHLNRFLSGYIELFFGKKQKTKWYMCSLRRIFSSVVANNFAN